MLTCRIARFRQAAGLSQQALGAAVGVTGAAIGQYEKGVRRPNPDVLWKIARQLGVGAGDLYEDDGQSPAPAPASGE